MISEPIHPIGSLAAVTASADEAVLSEISDGSSAARASAPQARNCVESWQQTLLDWQQLGIIRALDRALVLTIALPAAAAAEVATPAVPAAAAADAPVPDMPAASAAEAAAPVMPPATVWLWLGLASAQLAQGHLCLDLAQAFTKPHTLLSSALRFGRPLQSVQQFIAQQSLPEVFAQLSAASAWISVCSAEQRPKAQPFVLMGQRLYLYRYWQYEQTICRFFQQGQVLTRALRANLSPSPIRAQLNLLFPTADADAATIDWQQLACAMAATSNVAVITGGPGTGKTTTVVKLLLLLQQLALQQGPALNIQLAAPTGKAAARLSLSVSQALAKLAVQLALPSALLQLIPQQASTLHRLLGSGRDSEQYRYHADEPLPIDVLVVDEASMVDVALFAAMIAALPAHARLILLGDKDQLASVEAGAVMAELCQQADEGGYSQDTAAWLAELTGVQLPATYCSQTPSALEQQVVMLRTSHRFTADSGIGQLARAVNQGDAQRAFALLQQPPVDLNYLNYAPDSAEFASFMLYGSTLTPGAHPDAALHAARKPETAQQISLQNSQPFPQGFSGYLQLVKQGVAQDASVEDYNRWALAVLSEFSRFQVLAAARQGLYGVEQLNQRIAHLLAKHQWIARTEGWYAGRPVMVVQNDYSTGLMNGDVGICLPRYELVDEQWQYRLRVVFPAADAQQQVRWLLPSRLPQVETVYAMTVHKSQGSEFQHAVLILPDAMSPILTKELVYTGITRAAREFTLLCPEPDVFIQAVQQKTERSGGLRMQRALL